MDILLVTQLGNNTKIPVSSYLLSFLNCSLRISRIVVWLISQQLPINFVRER